LRGFHKSVAQSHIYFLICLCIRAHLGKLWGHEDMLGDRPQDIGIEDSSSGGRHGRQKKTVNAVNLKRQKTYALLIAYKVPSLPCQAQAQLFTALINRIRRRGVRAGRPGLMCGRLCNFTYRTLLFVRGFRLAASPPIATFTSWSPSTQPSVLFFQDRMVSRGYYSTQIILTIPPTDLQSDSSR